MTGAERAVPPRSPHLVTLVALSGLGALAMNMFLPSIPNMAQEFGVEYGVMQLAVSGYLAASAALQLFIGPISDRFGRRPVMIGALILFILASIGTLITDDAALFLAFRMAQAVSAVGMVISRAVIRDTVSADMAASRLGYVVMGMSVIPMLAPALGGMLQEGWGWEGSFVVMLIAGVVVLAMTWADLNETGAGGGVSLRQQIATYPVLARSVRFWGYAITATLSSGAFFAYLGGAPFVGIEIFDMSPATLGYWFAAPSIGYFLGNFTSGRYSVRFGINRMVLTGSVIVMLSMAVALAIDLSGLHHPLAFFAPVAVMGLGNGMVLPNANAGMMSVRPELAGTASGLGGALAIAGGAALSALAGAMLGTGTGARPLLAIMLLSAIGSVIAILWVIRRESVLRGH